MKHISIDAYTAYDALFPGRKFLEREVLILVKTLKSEGYAVQLLPESAHYQYLFKKGETSFLADPANLLLVSIPVTIVSTLITNWIQKLIDKKQGKHPATSNVIVYNFITNQTTNHINQRLDAKAVADSKEAHSSKAIAMAECLNTESPYPDLPFPILLEHQPIIIGWCTLKSDDKGLLVDDGKITDVDAYKKIQKGELRGVSVTGIANESRCSICQQDYLTCNHIAGQNYEGSECICFLIEGELVEVSLVTTPINPKTLLKLL